MSGRCGKLNSNEITRWAGFRQLTGEHMAQGNNKTAMCSKQTRVNTNMTNRECHSSVTKPRHDPNKVDRTVTFYYLEHLPKKKDIKTACTILSQNTLEKEPC